MNLKRISYLGLMAAVLPFPQIALAQDGAEAASEDFALEVITVTARKRSENLQNTPISITAFSEASLEARQIDNISQVATFTPNLIFDTSSAISGSKSSASVFIRGVGQIDFNLSVDPGVGLYLDGVYIARSIGSVLDIVDIEQVEILRGPQGTLFGRNTIGGAINVVTKKPTDEFGGAASITAGRFNRWHVKGNVNIPISEKLLSSFSLARFSRGGHIDRPNLGDTTGGDNSWGGRGSFLWMPTDNVDVSFAFDATTIREQSCCSELVAVNENGFFAAANNGIALGPVPLDPSDPNYFGQDDLPTAPFQDNTDIELPSNLDIWGVNLTVDVDLDNGMTFKSITAYRELDSFLIRNNVHAANVQFGQTGGVLDQQQFSQEFQLQGQALDDRMKWIVGLYYFDEKGININDVVFDPVVHIISGGKAHSRSIAAFTQATYDVSEKLSLTAGLRWTKDNKDFAPEGFQYVIDSGIGLPPGFLLVPDDEREISAKEFLPMANLAYQWTDDFMTYATFSRGFKGGGFSQNVFPPLPELPSFDPEFVTVYEVGFKSSAFDNRLRLNGAAFQTNYDDMQVVVIEFIAPVTKNAAKARIKGFEVELTAAPVDNLMFEVGVGYLDAKYLEIDANALLTGLTLDHKLVNTPKWSLNASVNYSMDFMGLGTLTPRIDWSHKSSYANDAFNEPVLDQEGYSLLNASISFEDYDEEWLFVLSGTNLTNERYKITGFSDLATQSLAEAAFGRPVEWAFTVKRRF
ncbi:MAG: TonB-dependent receptor [Kordiimonadaceae bacterium]|nr:TonB-dependent receptor [Kordiimonadaceae bacterium]